MKIEQYISISWTTCEEGCCKDSEYFRFEGTPHQALQAAQEAAKRRPTAFKIRIFQSEE